MGRGLTTPDAAEGAGGPGVHSDQLEVGLLYQPQRIRLPS